VTPEGGVGADVPRRPGGRGATGPKAGEGGETVERLARALSLLFNPLLFATVFDAVLLVGHGLGWWRYVVPVWALLVALPALVLFVGIRAGVWSDVDVSRLRERRSFMPIALAAGSASLALALLAHFPPLLRFSLLAIVAWLLISTVVGMFWKLSLHVGAAVGIVILLGVSFGREVATGLAWLPVALGWARLRLEAHDIWQVLGGAAVGLAAVGVAMAVMALP
jgi:hypothetical protein